MRSCAVVMQSAIYIDPYSKYISSTQTFLLLCLVTCRLFPDPTLKVILKVHVHAGVCRYEAREPQLLKLPYHNNYVAQINFHLCMGKQVATKTGRK